MCVIGVRGGAAGAGGRGRGRGWSSNGVFRGEGAFGRLLPAEETPAVARSTLGVCAWAMFA